MVITSGVRCSGRVYKASLQRLPEESNHCAIELFDADKFEEW